MKLSFRGNTAILLVLTPLRLALAQAGAWQHATDLRSPRNGAAAFVADSKLYVIGGQNQSRFLATAEAYDTLTRQWATLPPLRLGRTFSATNSAQMNGVLYVSAGNPRGYCTSGTDAFDTATRQWHLLRAAPVARCHAATLAVDDRVWLIGGWNTSSTARYTQIDSYDPATNRWSPVATLPRPRGAMVAARIGRSIYLAGGWEPDAAVSASVDVYDLETHRWSSAPPMHVPRSGAAGVVLEGRLYVIGGIAAAGEKSVYTSAVESYDPVTRQWRTEPSLPFPIAYASAVAIGERIYLIGGGKNDGSILATVFTYEPAR